MQDSFEEDYPAAHSMDTTWFAVDKDGSVAIFNSNETGAVPCAHSREQSDGEEFFAHLAKLQGENLPDDYYNQNLGEKFGLFEYSCEMGVFPPGTDEDEACRSEIIAPYERQFAPSNPLKISSLPEFLQDEAKHAFVYSGSFASSLWLQPALLVPCENWAEGPGNVGAVDEDGNVKAVPDELSRHKAPPRPDRPALPKIEKPPKDEFGDINFWRRHLK